jgi:hypothetical protein
MPSPAVAAARAAAAADAAAGVTVTAAASTVAVAADVVSSFSSSSSLLDPATNPTVSPCTDYAGKQAEKKSDDHADNSRNTQLSQRLQSFTHTDHTPPNTAAQPFFNSPLGTLLFPSSPSFPAVPPLFSTNTPSPTPSDDLQVFYNMLYLTQLQQQNALARSLHPTPFTTPPFFFPSSSSSSSSTHTPPLSQLTSTLTATTSPLHVGPATNPTPTEELMQDDANTSASDGKGNSSEQARR